MPTSAGVTPKFTQPQPSQVRQKNARSKDDQLSLDALHDIATGQESPTKERQGRRQQIEEYIKTQKSTFHDVLGQPGVKVSGFNHIIMLPPSGAPVKSDWRPENDDFDTKQIATESLNRMLDSSYVPSCDTFTLNEMLKKERPSQNTFEIPKVPVHGQDFYGNKVFAMPFGHKSAAKLFADLVGGSSNGTGTHPETANLNKDDQWAWARNVWLAALMHSKRADLKTILEDAMKDAQGNTSNADQQVIQRILAMADAIRPALNASKQAKKALEDANGDVTKIDPKNVPGFNYDPGKIINEAGFLQDLPKAATDQPADTEQTDIESELKKLTAKLLCNHKDKFDRELGSDPEEPVPSHIFSLMNALGSTVVLFGGEHEVENVKHQSVYVSSSKVKSEAEQLGQDATEDHEQFVRDHMVSGPVFSRQDGKFSLRMPSLQTRLESLKREMATKEKETEEKNGGSAHPDESPTDSQNPSQAGASQRNNRSGQSSSNTDEDFSDTESVGGNPKESEEGLNGMGS